MLTPRLEVRLPREPDRTRFVELFCDEDFMVFSSGVLTTDAAHARFDEMLVRGRELTFAKQPVIERSTGIIVGYAGVNWFDFEVLDASNSDTDSSRMPAARATPLKRVEQCSPLQRPPFVARSWP